MQLDNVVLDSACEFLVTHSSFAPASTGAATIAEQTITLVNQPALKTTDAIEILQAATPGNAVRPIYARATSATAIAVSFINPTAGALTYATGAWLFRVIRQAA